MNCDFCTCIEMQQRNHKLEQIPTDCEEGQHEEEIQEARFTNTIHAIWEEVVLSGDMKKTKAMFCNYRSAKRKPLHLIMCCIDVLLRGVSQVYICDHPLSGVLICIGVGLSSIQLLLHGLIGTMFSTLAAAISCRLPYEKISGGLIGYDGALVGCAVWTFLASNPSLTSNDDDLEDAHRTSAPFMGGLTHIVITVFLSSIAGILHMACANALSLARLPPFTSGFNLATFFFLLSVAKGNVTVASFRISEPSSHPEGWTNMSVLFLLDATFRGVGQFMFADTTPGSVCVVLGIALQSRRDAACALLGALIGALTAVYLLQVPPDDLVAVRSGLYGYNSAGTCVVLAGGRFYQATRPAYFVGIVGAMVAVYVQVMYKSTLYTQGHQLPVLTFPFITTAWIMMMTQSDWLKVREGGDIDQENVAPTRVRPTSLLATKVVGAFRRMSSWSTDMSEAAAPHLRRMSSFKSSTEGSRFNTPPRIASKNSLECYKSPESGLPHEQIPHSLPISDSSRQSRFNLKRVLSMTRVAVNPPAMAN